MVAAGAPHGIKGSGSTAPADVLKLRDRRPYDGPKRQQYAAYREHVVGPYLSRVLNRWTQLFPAAILTLILGAASSVLGQPVELSPSTSCAEIVAAIKRLSTAEHHQAQALQLMARGGDSALVEGKFQILLERKRELSFTLKRISMDPVAADASVNKCLSSGYQALYQSERLSANIERLLLRSRLHSQSQLPLSGLGQPAAAATP
jgi:hypothetical protein